MATPEPDRPRYRTFDPTVLVGKEKEPEGPERPGEESSPSEPTPTHRLFDPALLFDGEPDAARDGPVDSALHYLTRAVLGVCLVLWAILGFALWVPLLIRAIISFSLSLSQSMLAGSRPDAAGRILYDAVGFYRRGFTVAIDSFLGGPSTEGPQARHRLSFVDFAFEIVWATLVWYVLLAAVGIVETSPVDLWYAAVARLTDGLYELERLITGGSAGSSVGTGAPSGSP